MTELTYSSLTATVAQCLESDWSTVRGANKILARVIDGNESTIKGIKKGDHCPSLLNGLKLAQQTPSLRNAILEMLGVDLSASSEAKRIQMALKALRGEYDETIQGNSTGLPHMARAQRIN